MKLLLKSALLASAAMVFAAMPASASEELREMALDIFEPLPSTIPPLGQGRSATPEKVELGKALFFEPRLSLSGVFSCNSCHNVGMGGDDNQETSVGHGWQVGPRNSPTVFNSVLNAAQFWDGRADDLAEQAVGPIQAGVEMANTPDNVIATLTSMPQYVEWFEAAYPDEDNPVTFENVAFALEAFQATLITPAPFDAFLNGDDAAMSDMAKAGLQVFVDEGCAACHAGVNLGGQDYFPFGLVTRPGAHILPEDDLGRYQVTGTATDQWVFRASPLRNIRLTSPYFHSGEVWDLRAAVQIMANSQIGADLTEEQVDQIVAFLDSLTGEQPQIVHPILPPETRDTPRPQPEVLLEQ